MNVQEAAVQILKRAGKALHIREITKRILANVPVHAVDCCVR